MFCHARFVNPARMFLLLWTLVLIAAFVGLMVGSVNIAPRQVLGCLMRLLSGAGCSDATDRILWSVRLPRIILSLAVGASMGMTGLAAQTLFRNPLASPYVMGVSNGAAVGAVLGLLLVGRGVGYGAVPLFSMASAFAVTMALFLLARRGRQFGQSLLLAGIAVSAFCSALTAGALYLAGERLQTLVFWLMGGIWQATWRDVFIMLPVCGVCFVVLRLLAPGMNVALVGERSARDLGLEVRRLQQGLLWLVAGVTAVAVSLTGVIGFVGLIVPHVLRLVMGADHRGLVPATALGGALLLLIADTLARTVAAPAEIPVGILTTLVGAPVFLWMLQRRGAGVGPP